VTTCRVVDCTVQDSLNQHTITQDEMDERTDGWINELIDE